MFTERTMSDRLARIYADASPECHAMADWYASVAAADCASIAADTDLPFRVVAATMAVLSPGPKYSQNVTDTRRMCEWWSQGGEPGRIPTVTTYGPNRAKAVQVLTYRDASYVSGPKVEAFFRNICGDWSHVTLDRHAVRPLSKSGADMPKGKGERQRMETAYRKAAAKAGLAPAQFQAVVWCAVRGKAR